MQEQPTTPTLSLGKERLQIGAPLLAVAFIFLCTAVAQVLIDALLSTLAPALCEKDFYPWMLASVPMYLVAMPLSLILFRLSSPTPPTRREKLSLPVMLGLVAICFFVTYLGNFLGSIVNFIIGAITGQMPENDLDTMTASAPLWTNLLFVGILAPVMEEIFFRKLVIDRLRRYGDLFACLASGVLFGIVHGNFYQFFYAAAMGVIFGYLYLRTGRLRYSLILHLSINLVGGVYASEMLKIVDLERLSADPVAFVAENPAGVLMLLSYFGFMLLCALGAVVALVLLAVFWVKHYRPERGTCRLTAREWVHVLLLNPALWIFLVFAILLFL